MTTMRGILSGTDVDAEDELRVAVSSHAGPETIVQTVSGNEWPYLYLIHRKKKG